MVISMPVDINNLADGWLELESDPGLFTLLLEDMGVRGVQVEEIYDLQKSFEGKVYGFIFLFRWIEERRSRRKIVENPDNYVKDENIVNNMFFAQQMVPNSCATHSLVSVLLNCSTLDLGPTLSRLKIHTVGMDPENKGWAIGNTPELANAHNSHAAPQARRRPDKTPGVPTSSRTTNAETFHFVSYVPVNGRLVELDGLKPCPIDHGPWVEGEDWTEKFRRVITERLGIATGGEPYHDIRFNLMAVVPDKITAYRRKLCALQNNRETVFEALHQFVHQKYPAYIGKEKPAESNLPNTQDEMEEGNNLSLLAVAASQKLEAQGYAHEATIEDHEPFQVARLHHMAARNQHSLMPLGMPSAGSISAPPDYATPLTIETSPEPPSTPSTDTASEQGSDFNSPQGSPSATCEFQRLVVVRLAPFTPTLPLPPPPPPEPKAETSESSPHPECSPATATETVEGAGEGVVDGVGTSLLTQVLAKQLQFDDGMYDRSPLDNESLLNDYPPNAPMLECVKSDPATEGIDSSGSEVSSIRNCESSSFGSEFSVKQECEVKSETEADEDDKMPSKTVWEQECLAALQDGTSSPADLLTLVKTLSKEISTCESLLKDELEKRKRYKIDDSRRTHNYDQFIITFLAMLAEQGKIGDLVKQQMQPTRKRPAPSPATPRGARPPMKKTESKSSPNSSASRKRGRKKKSKGKRKR